MDKERFAEILKAQGLDQKQIDALWNEGIAGQLTEEEVKDLAEFVAPIKDLLVA